MVRRQKNETLLRGRNPVKHSSVPVIRESAFAFLRKVLVSPTQCSMQKLCSLPSPHVPAVLERSFLSI
jgi:hypothetical protein